MRKPITDRDIELLAVVLYEQFAERLARTYGEAAALSFFHLMSENVRNLWRGWAREMLTHSAEWGPNVGSGCVLSRDELTRIRALPRVIEDKYGDPRLVD